MSSIEQILATGIPSASGGQDALLSSGQGASRPPRLSVDGQSRPDTSRLSTASDGVGEAAKELAKDAREFASGKGAGVDPDELNEAIEAIREKLEPGKRSLDFSVNETLNDVVVKVIDPTSDQVIREIPPEAIIAMRERLREYDELNLADVLPSGSLLSDFS